MAAAAALALCLLLIDRHGGSERAADLTMPCCIRGARDIISARPARQYLLLQVSAEQRDEGGRGRGRAGRGD